MENQTYEVLNLRKKELAKIAENQLEIAKKMDGDLEEKAGTQKVATATEKVAGTLERLNREHFNVLIVGCFSSGKSTFLNALLGEKLLPQSALPCTGVLTFLRYASEAEKKILIYKKGVPEPEIIAGTDLKEELKKRVRIPPECEKEDATKASPYEKAEVFYPLELCKNGVEIIDSVGLNDPEARDKITLDYAKSADAIIYCVDSGHAKTMADVRTLRDLGDLGFKNIFCIITFYDKLVENCEEDGNPLEKVKESMVTSLSALPGLNRNGIFFVDSKGALKNDEDAVKLLAKMETSLEQFLVNGKGKNQLSQIVDQLGNVNADLTSRIQTRMDLLAKDASEIERKIERSKIPLQNRENEVRGIIEDLNGDVEDAINEMRHRAETAYDSIANFAESIVQTYQFSSSEPDDWSRELTSALESSVRERSNENRAAMNQDFERYVKRLQSRLERNIASFNANMSELRADIDLGSSPNSLAEIDTSGNFLVEFGSGFAIGAIAVSLLGWFAIPVIFFAPKIIGELTRGSREAKFRQAASQEVKKNFTSAKRTQFVSKIVDDLQERLESFRANVESALNGEIAKIRADLQHSLEIQRGDKSKKEAAIKECQENLAKNAELLKMLKQFKAKIV